MREFKEIVIISSEMGDWDAMYIDGILQTQGHSLHYRDAFEYLKIEYLHYELSEELCEEWSRFPEKLDDFRHILS